MTQEEKSEATMTSDGPSTDRPNDERYDAQRVEQKWFARWQQDASLYAAESRSTKANSRAVVRWLPGRSPATACASRTLPISEANRKRARRSADNNPCPPDARLALDANDNLNAPAASADRRRFVKANRGRV